MPQKKVFVERWVPWKKIRRLLRLRRDRQVIEWFSYITLTLCLATIAYRIHTSSRRRTTQPDEKVSFAIDDTALRNVQDSLNKSIDFFRTIERESFILAGNSSDIEHETYEFEDGEAMGMGEYSIDIPNSDQEKDNNGLRSVDTAIDALTTTSKAENHDGLAVDVSDPKT